jgi:uncharacterized protein (TIGR02145 family)
MGQYGNQPDFGTRAVAITPKGFAGGSYVNVSYQDSGDTTQNIYLTSTSLNVSTLNDGTPIVQAFNATDWDDYYSNTTPCWAYYNFKEINAKYGKVYNWVAVANSSLYSDGFSLPDYSIASQMTNDYGYNESLSAQLKSIPTAYDGQDLTGTTLWNWGGSGNEGTNIYGFTGLPGGYWSGDDEAWNGQWDELRFWTSNYGDGQFIGLFYNQADLKTSIAKDTWGYYVRLQVDPKNNDYVAPQPLNSAALYVGTGGDLVVTIVGSETPVMFKNVPDASFLPIIVSNVWERGDDGLTTASDIIAIY